jgi:hypothetical protein
VPTSTQYNPASAGLYGRTRLGCAIPWQGRRGHEHSRAKSTSKTRFLTPIGAWLFLRLPMGVRNDIDGNGFVDVADPLYLIDASGSVKGDAIHGPRCDINIDGAVDVADRLAMVDNWGTSIQN